MGKTRDKISRNCYRFLIVMATFMATLIFLVWVSPARTGNLPAKVEQELKTEQELAMAMKAWEQILQISPCHPSLAKIKIFQAIENFTDNYIRWSAGIEDIEDGEKMYLHPLEIQRTAKLLLRYAIEMADIPPDGDGNGDCSLSEYKLFLKQYAFHYKVVKSIAGIEE